MKKAYILFCLLFLAGLVSFFFDKTIISFITGLRVSSLDLFFKLISDSVWFVGGLAALIGIYLLIKKKKEGWIILLSLILSLGLGYLLKFLVGRERPDVLQLASGFSNTSFPSTHTVTVFCLLPFIFLRYKRFRWVYLVFCLIIAFSRLYLGVHYLSDVLFGALIGLVFGYVLEKKFF